jgi:hypothetical protein
VGADKKFLKNEVFWDVTSCGSLRTGVSEELSAPIIKVTRIVDDGGAKFLRNIGSYKRHTA